MHSSIYFSLTPERLIFYEITVSCNVLFAKLVRRKGNRLRNFLSDLSGQTILQVLPSLERGGVERGTVEMVRAISEAGGRALVASQGGNLVEQVLQNGGEHYSLSLASKSPLDLWRNKKKLISLCRDEHVTLLHARSRGPAWSAFWAVKELKIPWVTTFHGIYNFSNEGKKYYNSVMVRGNRAIAISEFVREHLSLFYRKWVHPSQIPVIYRGVDLDTFDPKKILPEDIQLLKKEWGIPQGSAVLLMPARFSRWKGHREVLKACEIIRNQNFILVLVGSSTDREGYCQELESLAKNLGIGEKVRFAAYTGTIARAYAASDLVIHASTDPEAFGRVVAEAQAMGKWTIVSHLGAPQEIILHQKTGEVVNPKDSQALAKSLLRGLSLDVDQRMRVEDVARRRIRERFSLEKMQQQTLEVYAELLGCFENEVKHVA